MKFMKINGIVYSLLREFKLSFQDQRYFLIESINKLRLRCLLQIGYMSFVCKEKGVSGVLVYHGACVTFTHTRMPRWHHPAD